MKSASPPGPDGPPTARRRRMTRADSRSGREDGPAPGTGGPPRAGDDPAGTPGAARRRRPSTGLAGRGLPWLFVAAAAAYCAVFWSEPIGPGRWSPLGESAMVAGDSHSYRDFGLGRWATRWAGYPVFLDLVGRLSDHPQAVARVQLLLAALSVAFLAWSLLRTLSAPRLSLTVAALLFAECAVARFHAYFVSEAVFVPLLTLLAGVVARVGARPADRQSPWLFAAASALLGLAVTVRPSGLFLLAIAPGLLLLFGRRGARRDDRGRARQRRDRQRRDRQRRDRQRRDQPRRDRPGRGGLLRPLALLLALLLPLAFALLAEDRVWSRVYPHLERRPNIANRHLFAKALLLPSEPPASGDPALAEFFADARRALAPVRAALAGVPDGHLRSVLLARAEHGAQHSTYFRLFRQRAVALAEARGLPSNHLLGALGRSALLAAPGEWLDNARVHYVALWTHDALHDEDFALRHRAYAAGLEQFFDGSPGDSLLLSEAGLRNPVPPSRRLPGWALVLNRAAAFAAFTASLLALGIAAGQRLRRGAGGLAPEIVVAAVSAAAVQGYFLLIAVFNYGKMRYAAAMWPFSTLCGLLLLHWALRHWQRRRRAPT